MAEISPVGFDATIRHATYLERLKAEQVRQITPMLRQIDEKLRARLSKGELTTFGRARLERLLESIDKQLKGILDEYGWGLSKELTALPKVEAAFEASSLAESVKNPRFEATVPAPAKIVAAAMASPLGVKGIHGGKLLKGFIKGWSDAQRDTLTGIIRTGSVSGQTNAEIIRAIRGDARLGFRNGALAQTRNQTAAMTRTAVQHISHQARLATLQANSRVVKKYRWLSTLDDRTSELCQGLSGEIFEVGNGPIPPAHVNCRSTIVAVLEGELAEELRKGRKQASQFGPVDAKENYFDWMKRQPAAFQDDALGPVKARLLRRGGLSGEEFRKLTRADNFRPLTLAEMAKKNPLAFERAGIRITESGRPVLPRASKSPPRSAPPAPPTPPTPPPAPPAPTPPPAPVPAARSRSTTAKVGEITKPPEPWNLGGSKANLTNASLTKVLQDLGTPEAKALVDFLNHSKVGMIYGEPTKFGSRSWRIRTGKAEGKAAWKKFTDDVGRPPDGRATYYSSEPWARGIEDAGGYTRRSQNYVVLLDHGQTAASAGLSDMAKLDVKRLREKLKGSLSRVNRPRYDPDAGRLPNLDDKAYTLAHDSAHVYGLGTDADTFLKWVHEIGHQVDYRARYTVSKAGGDFYKAYQIPADAVRVSGYAHANDLEWFAETFCAWIVDREALLALDPRAVKIIDEAVAAALKYDPTP